MKKFSIWSDTHFWDRNAMEDYEEETRAFLMEDGEDEPSDYEIYERIQEENGFFYEDERANIGAIDLPENIICIANLYKLEEITKNILTKHKNAIIILIKQLMRERKIPRESGQRKIYGGEHNEKVSSILSSRQKGRKMARIQRNI